MNQIDEFTHPHKLKPALRKLLSEKLHELYVQRQAALEKTQVLSAHNASMAFSDLPQEEQDLYHEYRRVQAQLNELHAKWYGTHGSVYDVTGERRVHLTLSDVDRRQREQARQDAVAAVESEFSKRYEALRQLAISLPKVEIKEIRSKLPADVVEKLDAI